MAPFVLGEAKTTLAVILIVDMIVGLSLLVLAGWAGQISLGQFAFGDRSELLFQFHKKGPELLALELMRNRARNEP